MLAAEGYVLAKPRSGFVVARLQQQLLPPPTGQQQKGKLPEPKGRQVRYSFATGDIDTSLFARKTYARLLREVMSGEEELFARGEAAGDEVLREAIAEYLRGYRGVKCEAGQIVVGAGLEVLMGMLGPLLGGAVAVETPGYAKTRRILGNVGVQAVPVPVDGQGMLPGALAQSGARAAYLTPSHQFPTGGAMPVGRRTELLRWAAEGGRLLVEDDYDSEFRFDGRPLPSLQGLDEGGHVVYAGTFSRSLAPGLRAAYLVLPQRLQESWQKAYGDYACTVSRPEQHTLARFMAEGHFARSLNRMRGVYRHRRGLVLQALKRELRPEEYEVQNEHTGLYFLLRLPGCATKSIAAALEHEVTVHALGEYCLQKRQGEMAFEDKDVLVLGYGGLDDGDVAAAVKALATVIHGGL
jgi:GntR family transcriptional regulator/MocR family aminotransferase